MTLFEVLKLIMDAVPAIVAVIGTLFVASRNYRKLLATVAKLVKAMEDLKPQLEKVDELAKLYTAMRVDIELIKKDVATIRETQQLSALDRPQKGKLPKLETDDTPEEE